MLNMLENYYWRYNSASELVNAILSYIDIRAAQLFSRREYLDLSESMFQMILSRDLNISEVSKFQVMLQWANYKIEMSSTKGIKFYNRKNIQISKISYINLLLIVNIARMVYKSLIKLYSKISFTTPEYL